MAVCGRPLVTDEVQQRQTPVRARAFIDAAAVSMCRWILGTRLSIGPAAPDGRIEAELLGQSPRALAGEIAGLGRAVEIVDNDEVRRHLAQLGRELVETYGD